jgi:hypothetical protein
MTQKVGRTNCVLCKYFCGPKTLLYKMCVVCVTHRGFVIVFFLFEQQLGIKNSDVKNINIIQKQNPQTNYHVDEVKSLTNDDEKLTNGDEDSGHNSGDELYARDDSVYCYDKMAPGSGKKIQLENPDKKELLVRFFVQR